MKKYRLTFEIEVADDAQHPRKWAAEAILANLHADEQLLDWTAVEVDMPEGVMRIPARDARIDMTMCFSNPRDNYLIEDVSDCSDGQIKITGHDGTHVEWYDADEIIWVKR